jgi:hypothetical protein
MAAAGALWNMAFEGDNHAALRAAGIVGAMKTLATAGSIVSDALRTSAAGVLWELDGKRSQAAVAKANKLETARKQKQKAAADVDDGFEYDVSW